MSRKKEEESPGESPLVTGSRAKALELNHKSRSEVRLTVLRGKFKTFPQERVILVVKPIKLRRIAEQERLRKVAQEEAQKEAHKITSQFVTDFLRMAGPIRKDVDIAICPVGDRVIIATYKRNGDGTVRLAVRGTLPVPKEWVNKWGWVEADWVTYPVERALERAGFDRKLVDRFNPHSTGSHKRNAVRDPMMYW